MPDNSSRINELRSSHSARVYLSLMTGDAVLTGTVSADASEVSALNIAYTLDTGDAADVQPGYRVMIYSSGGDFKGMTSVRFSGTINSTNLPVREFSSGEIIVVSGDTFTVYDDPVLTDKLPSADVSFSPDSTTYTDQNSNPAPITTSGGWWAGWLGEGGTVDIEFDGSDSSTVDPDSGGSINHLWECASGTWDDDTSATPTLTLNAAGKYVVFHTVTDVSNSKITTQVVRVRVHDANDPPYEIALTNNSMDAANGAAVSVTVFEDANLTTIPDLAPVIVWHDQKLGGVTANYGAAVESRSHIVICGFFRRDTTRGSGETGLEEIEFEIMNPLARLGELPGFSKVMLYNASPSDWQNIKGLTVKRAIIHLLRNYTNITQFCDLVFDGFPDASYPAFYVQKQTTPEQVRELGESRGGRIVCDRTGRVEVQLRIEYTPLVSRTALTTTVSLGVLDVINYEMSRTHAPTIETYRARGIKAATDSGSAVALFARWPASPGRGNQSPVIDKLICDDQADLFNQCALRGAWENGVFYEAGGIHHYAPELRLTLFGGYAHLFQFYRELVYINLPDNMRGIDTLQYRFIPQSVTVDYEGGTATTTLVLRAETHAAGAYAVDDTPATESTPITSTPNVGYTPILTTSPSVDNDGLSATTDTLAVFDSGGNSVHIVSNFRSVLTGGTPTSVEHNLSLTGTLASFCFKAGTSVNGYLATTSEVRTISDVFGTRTLGTAYSYASGAAVAARQVNLQSERGNSEFVLVVVYNDTGGVNAYRSTNGGGAWSTESTLPAYYDNNLPANAGTWMPGLWLHADGGGRALTSAAAATANPPGGDFWETSDYGATWSIVATSGWDAGDWPCGSIAKPLNGSATYHGYVYYSAPNVLQGIRRIVGTTQTNITPSYGGNDYGTGYGNTVGQRVISVADDDANAVCVVGYNTSTGYYGVFQSFDRGTTWNTVVTPGATSWRGAYYVNRTTIYLYGASGALGIALYSGGVWTVYSTTISGCGTIVGLCGGS